MIYLHIPFCKQKCSYCNFHFSTSLKGKEDFLSAVKKEISLRRDELSDKNLKSVYFGGGTPSLLASRDINELLDGLLKYHTFDPQIEITLEANPDDLTPDFVRALATQTPVNRLSIGTQSFEEADLRLMNRAHTAAEAEDSIRRAQDFGLSNISIDLIYGSPTAGPDSWKNNLEKTTALQVPHVSAYALTIEPKTALSAWIRQGKIAAPREEHQHADFFYMTGYLKAQGFAHYEISNFAKHGFESRHNRAYWQYQPYLGLGPSAHSYNGGKVRSWNIANNQKYAAALAEGILPRETEMLTEKEQYNEMIMLGLRTARGVDLGALQQKFSAKTLNHFRQEVQKKLAAGLVVGEDKFLRVAEAHWFLADGIAADFFLV